MRIFKISNHKNIHQYNESNKSININNLVTKWKHFEKVFKSKLIRDSQIYEINQLKKNKEITSCSHLQNFCSWHTLVLD